MYECQTYNSTNCRKSYLIIKDHMEVWTPNPENPIRVLYHAVRDEEGKYIGTVELVQQFKDVKNNLLNADVKRLF